MQHLDFDENQYNIYEDGNTLEILYKACNDGIISRTFSNWHQLSSVRNIMQMLGYTVHHTTRTDARRKYTVVSWFGNDKDTDNAFSLLTSIAEE